MTLGDNTVIHPLTAPLRAALLLSLLTSLPAHAKDAGATDSSVPTLGIGETSRLEGVGKCRMCRPSIGGLDGGGGGGPQILCQI